jgi:hypothetical protein
MAKKIYCGIRKLGKNQQYGTFGECFRNRQIRRYGEIKLTVGQKNIMAAAEQIIMQRQKDAAKLRPKKKDASLLAAENNVLLAADAILQPLSDKDTYNAMTPSEKAQFTRMQKRKRKEKREESALAKKILKANALIDML